MLRRPRIAIPVPTSFDPAYNAQSWPEYAAAVERSGAEAVRVELNETLPTVMDGVLLPGSGADVLPSRYGHAAQPETAPADAQREAIDLDLLHRVETQGLPLLAICFGLQSLNVHRGGTLVQDLASLPVNHRAGRPVLDAHSVVFAEHSRLESVAAGLALSAPRWMVNSSHHQAVGAVGEGLVVASRSAQDGVIEALEDPAHPWLLGVQWHPERTFDHSSLSRSIFDQFVDAARKRMR